VLPPINHRRILVNGGSPQGFEVERSSERDIKILRVTICPQKKHGGIPMFDHDKRFPTSPYAQRVQDVLLVSSFAMWAMVLGFAPVLTYRLLVS